MKNEEVRVQYSGAAFSAEIAENFKELFPEQSDLSYEEFLLQQEIVYQSLQGNDSDRGTTSSYILSGDLSQLSVQEGESSQDRSGNSVDSQLALDEALARSLQELGDVLDESYISEPTGSAAENRDITSRETPISSRAIPVSSEETPVRVQSTSSEVRQDDIDPDEMTYEQLLSLGDVVGAESRGLSENLISRLPYFKYRTGLFSKKKKKEECVICCTKYESGVYLTILPCAHQYHSECITHWLKINKYSCDSVIHQRRCMGCDGWGLFLETETPVDTPLRNITFTCPICNKEIDEE